MCVHVCVYMCVCMCVCICVCACVCVYVCAHMHTSYHRCCDGVELDGAVEGQPGQLRRLSWGSAWFEGRFLCAVVGRRACEKGGGEENWEAVGCSW